MCRLSPILSYDNETLEAKRFALVRQVESNRFALIPRRLAGARLARDDKPRCSLKLAPSSSEKIDNLMIMSEDQKITSVPDAELTLSPI